MEIKVIEGYIVNLFIFIFLIWVCNKLFRQGKPIYYDLLILRGKLILRDIENVLAIISIAIVFIIFYYNSGFKNFFIATGVIIGIIIIWNNIATTRFRNSQIWRVNNENEEIRQRKEQRENNRLAKEKFEKKEKEAKRKREEEEEERLKKERETERWKNDLEKKKSLWGKIDKHFD